MTEIAPLPVLLLPGMDGTGRLFDAFVAALPETFRPIVVAYPVDPRMTYADYVDSVPLPDGPFAIVAESFSGPVGVQIAARHEARVTGLVLAASFVRTPSPALIAIASRMPALAFAKPPPVWALRLGMLDAHTSREEARVLSRVVDGVPGDVIKSRLRLIASVDVSATLASLEVPTLYLRATHDRLLGRGAIRDVRRAKPDVTCRDVRAPHLMLQCEAEACAAHVTQFLVPA